MNQISILNMFCLKNDCILLYNLSIILNKRPFNSLIRDLPLWKSLVLRKAYMRSRDLIRSNIRSAAHALVVFLWFIHSVEAAVFTWKEYDRFQVSSNLQRITVGMSAEILFRLSLHEWRYFNSDPLAFAVEHFSLHLMSFYSLFYSFLLW